MTNVACKRAVPGAMLSHLRHGSTDDEWHVAADDHTTAVESRGVA